MPYLGYFKRKYEYLDKTSGEPPWGKVNRTSKGAAEEREALLRIAAGDKEAFAAIYDRYAPEVFALLVRMLNNRAEAEEQLQEVFLVLWRRAERFDAARGSLRTWLQVMTRRRAIDLLRARTSRPQVSSETDAAMVAQNMGSDKSPEEDASTQERAHTVHQALSSLSPLQSQTLHLAYFQGLSSYEIAERLETPVGTIKSRLRDALIRLRRALPIPSE